MTSRRRPKSYTNNFSVFSQLRGNRGRPLEEFCQEYELFFLIFFNLFTKPTNYCRAQSGARDFVQ